MHPETTRWTRSLSALFILLLLSGSCPGQANTMNWQPEKTIPFNAASFTTDNLGNVYFVTRDSGLTRYDIRTDSTSTYADFRYGNLATVDATNPLQLLLFYPDFSTILLMDRFLSFQNAINLRNLSLFNPDAVATSSDNRIWVYDEQEAKLKKIDLNGNPVLESVDLRQALELAPQPDIILDREGLVYLSDPAKGIFVFDDYGSYRNELHFTHIRSLQLFNGQLVMFHDGQMTVYDLRTLVERQVPLPDPSTILLARIERNQLYVLRKGMLEIYPIK